MGLIFFPICSTPHLSIATVPERTQQAMSVLATARVFDHEAALRTDPPAMWVKRDSIEVQRDRPANDDEPHDENPGLRDLLIPRARGRAAPPNKTEKKNEVGDSQAHEREAAEIEKDDKTQEVAASVEAAPEEAAPEVTPVDMKAGKPRRHIQWGEVHVRDYDLTLGDHPCCSYGPPLALSWEYTEYTPVNVDEYEFRHPPRRNLREMQIDYYNRKNVLALAGVAEKEWKRRVKEVGRAKRKREITVRVLHSYQLVQAEMAVESACRKFKRLIRNNRRQ